MFPVLLLAFLTIAIFVFFVFGEIGAFLVYEIIEFKLGVLEIAILLLAVVSILVAAKVLFWSIRNKKGPDDSQ